MKRLKRVFTNHSQVLHLWANQTQSDARSANVYFNGLSCYSYGSHYELGRLVQINGKTVALINTTGYSVTTSKHISSAFSATVHLPQISVGHDFNWKKGLLEMQDSIVDTAFNWFKGRSLTYYPYGKGPFNYYQDKIDSFNKTCDIVRMSQLKIELTEDYKKLLKSKIKVNKARQDVRDVEREKRRLEKEEKEKLAAQQDLSVWLSGGQYSYRLHVLSPQLIRVYGDKVETTRRAEVTLATAKRLLMRLENKAKCIGQDVDGFAVLAVNKATIKIGCHEIDINQAKQVLRGV